MVLKLPRLKRPSMGKSPLPSPATALDGYYRLPEAGIETRRYVGLDRNERLEPFPDWFMDNMRHAVTSELLTWYPTQDELERELSEYLSVPENSLILTPSSDSAFKSIYQAYIRPGDRVVMLDPSYAMFPVYAQMFQAEAVPIGFDQYLSLDSGSFLHNIRPGVRMIVIANPNQPTGTLIDEDLLIQILNLAANISALVVVDEAYYPFSKITALPLLKEYPNLIVTRTFSKAAGLAGLRIGYVVAHPNVVENLYKVRVVNDMNSFALTGARQIVKYPQIVDDYVATVEHGGQVLSDRCRNFGLIPIPTHTNFMLIRVGHQVDPSLLIEDLKTRGFLVKGLESIPCISDCIRVTLGPSNLMSRFADCLGDALEQTKSLSKGSLN